MYLEKRSAIRVLALYNYISAHLGWANLNYDLLKQITESVCSIARLATAPMGSIKDT